MIRRTYSLPYTIILAGLIHLGFAYGFLVIPVMTRNFVILGGVELLTKLHMSNTNVAASLLIATAAAYTALVLEGRPPIPRVPVLLLIFPQWLLFFASIFLICNDFITGQAAGRPVSRDLEITVLPGIFAASVFHTMAILERYFGVSWKWLTRYG